MNNETTCPYNECDGSGNIYYSWEGDSEKCQCKIDMETNQAVDESLGK